MLSRCSFPTKLQNETSERNPTIKIQLSTLIAEPYRSSKQRDVVLTHAIKFRRLLARHVYIYFMPLNVILKKGYHAQNVFNSGILLTYLQNLNNEC